jgi:hypothetical protein
MPLLNFKKQFVIPIQDGRKAHTIRGDRAIPNPLAGTGRASYLFPQYPQFADRACVSRRRIVIPVRLREQG